MSQQEKDPLHKRKPTNARLRDLASLQARANEQQSRYEAELAATQEVAQERYEALCGELRAVAFETDLYKETAAFMNDVQLNLIIEQCYEHWRHIEQTEKEELSLIARTAQTLVVGDFFGKRPTPEAFEETDFLNPDALIQARYPLSTLREIFGPSLEGLDAIHLERIKDAFFNSYTQLHLASQPTCVINTGIKFLRFAPHEGKECYIQFEMKVDLATYHSSDDPKSLAQSLSFVAQYKNFRDEDGVVFEENTCEEVKQKVLAHLAKEGHFIIAPPLEEEETPQSRFPFLSRIRRRFRG